MKKIISFMNFKGGCGKTTLTCLSALYLVTAKKASVRVSDRDQGKDTESFVRNINHDKIKLFDAAEDDDNYDYLLIDTPGGIVKEEMAQIAELSDLIVIPFALSPTDIRRTRKTGEALNGAENIRLLFNQVNTRTHAFTQRQGVLEALGLEALKNHLSKRVGYTYALAGGSDSLTTECIEELGKVVEEIIA
ncbi:ParA family protein [Cerasicoccus frondis]|uniref:ParA family protein n=1 Tax=Cerasicoccus frondis TaxID=490090 RepID=UPI002852D56A|nr:ParA family protein [Cerasicoccus frondis]